MIDGPNEELKKTGVIDKMVVEEEGWWEGMKFEIAWWFKNTLVYPWRSFRTGISNLIKYRKIIWRDRWWDYTFTLELLNFKLKDTEKHWGIDTHYENDYDEKQTLQEIIADLDWLLAEEENDLTTEYQEEYAKRSQSLFGKLARNHRKFWD